jgi:hypothetical protein
MQEGTRNSFTPIWAHVVSVSVSTAVWDGSQHAGSHLNLMLSIADQANNDGVAYPSNENVAHRLRISPRQAQRVIDEVIASGELKMLLKGNGRGHSARYQINVPMLEANAAKRRRVRHPLQETVTLATPIDEERATLASPIDADAEERATFSAERVTPATERATFPAGKGDISGRKGDAGVTRNVLTGDGNVKETCEPVARALAREGISPDDLSAESSETTTNAWAWFGTSRCRQCGRLTRLNIDYICEPCTRGERRFEALPPIEARVDPPPEPPPAALSVVARVPRCLQCGTRQDEPPLSKEACKNPTWHDMPLVEDELPEAASG